MLHSIKNVNLILNRLLQLVKYLLLIVKNGDCIASVSLALDFDYVFHYWISIWNEQISTHKMLHLFENFNLILNRP